MKKGLTELVFILDRSSSMGGLEEETIKGYNRMLKEQMKTKGRGAVTTVLFNEEVEIIHNRKHMDKMSPLNKYDYQVQGTTALLDAIGKTIDRTIRTYKELGKNNTPEKTIFVIITDGMENSSKLYNYKMVRRMIKHQRHEYDWEFLFLGANIDVEEEGNRLGINPNMAVQYECDERGTSLNYSAVSKAVATYRETGEIPNTWKEEVDRDFGSRGHWKRKSRR